MRVEGALLVGRAVSEHGLHGDERRTVAHVLGALKGALDRVQIVAVVELEHVPSVRAVARRDVLGEGDRRRRRQRHVVAVVEDDEAAEPEVTGERRRLALPALHQVAV